MVSERERARALLNQALAEARSRGASRITALHFVVYGSFHETEARLRRILQELGSDTPAEGAQVVVRAGPNKFLCWNCCALRFESHEERPACPNCGHTASLIPVDITFALDRIETTGVEEMAGGVGSGAATESLDARQTNTEASMPKTSVPYERKALYLLLTLPMIAMYVAIAVFLWATHWAYLAVYCGLFVLVAVFQSQVCVHWQCPHVGSFAPCVGGFCLPSSQIARLFKRTKRSEKMYPICLTLAYISFFGIILFPVYFIYRQGLVYMLVYLGVVAVYAFCFLLFICPTCGARHVCPGGQTAMRLKGAKEQECPVEAPHVEE
jgi:Zn finger protein HypA/HybF involved in hydrogenase expression